MQATAGGSSNTTLFKQTQMEQFLTIKIKTMGVAGPGKEGSSRGSRRPQRGLRTRRQAKAGPGRGRRR